MNDQKAAVCGTGTIGACLATLLAGNGIRTTVVGHSKTGMDRCLNLIQENLTALTASDKIAEEQRQTIFSLISVTDQFEQLKGIPFVFEAVAEELKIKEQVYGKIEAVSNENTVIASTTSAIPPHLLCRCLRHPERLLVAHPFQPAHLLPLFELVGHTETDPKLFRKTKEFLEKDLNRKVVCLHKEIEGFIVNRIAQAMFRECLYLIEQDVASVEDIDKAVHYAVGMRYASIGLLEYFDAVGFQLESEIAQTIYPTLCNTAQVQERVLRGISEKKTGIAAGEGLYPWNEDGISDFERRKSAPFLADFSWNLPK